ncbi:MAG: three-Cys-motif partner protein TcmP [Anaerolineae bacterium]
MEKYLLPEDDGLPARNFGPWVAEKLHYLKRYIDMFETSMRSKPWRRRIYIDLFAGSGKCYVDENREYYLGSPLLALTAKYPFTDCFFVDASPENIATLQERGSTSAVSVNIQYLVGDSNNKVKEIVSQIAEIDQQFIPGQWTSLNLAFLDPDGLELEWNAVAALAQVQKMDLIIHYSQNGITRNLEQCFNSEEETVIDRFFGDREWRKIYRDHQNKLIQTGIHRQLIDHYKSRLQALGYVDVRDTEDGFEPLIRNTKRKAPLYRLLFASKHKLGHDFWKEVTRKNVYGQQKLF